MAVGGEPQGPLLPLKAAGAVALWQQAQIHPVPRQQYLMEYLFHTASLAVPKPLMGELRVTHRVGAAAAAEVTPTAAAATAAVLFKVAPPEVVAAH